MCRQALRSISTVSSGAYCRVRKPPIAEAGERTPRDCYLLRQFGRSQQLSSQQRASILDKSPCRAERELFEEVIGITGGNSKFTRPASILNKSFRPVQPPQSSSP